MFFITVIIVGAFAFVPAPAKIPLTFTAGKSQVLERPSADRFDSLPKKGSIKTRKNVSNLSLPAPVHPLEKGNAPKLIHTVLVPQAFSYQVIQQPENKPYYVSSTNELVTEFRLAQKYNNIGLLAHNNLAGSKFKDLVLGQEVYIVHEDGHMDRYTISAIHRFKALESTKTESQFVDLESNITYSASEVFYQMYGGESHLTFQTCIAAEGDASWGRLFVIATPDDDFK